MGASGGTSVPGGGTKVDELFFVLSAVTGPLVAGMGTAQGALRKFTGFLKGPAGPIAAVTALGAAFAVAAVKGTKMAADLDQGLREVATLLPETVGQLEGVRSELVALSEQVPLPPELLSRALYQAVSAGARDTAEAMEVVSVASRAAAAGLTDAFTATDAITTALNAYGQSADQAARVADVLFATVERGKTTFAELAPSIGTVVTTAAQAGISLEEVGAAVATLTRRGVDIRVAMTSLNRLFLAFIKSSDEAKEAQEALGIELDAAKVQSIGLAGALEEINRGTGGLLDNLAKTNPNIRELRAALVLASNQGLKEFNADLAVTENSAGKANEAFREVTESAGQQYELFKNKLNAILLEIGTRTLPIIAEALRDLNRALESDTETLIRQLREVGEVELALVLQREETVKRLGEDLDDLQGRIDEAEQQARQIREQPTFREGATIFDFQEVFLPRGQERAPARQATIRRALADLEDLQLENLDREEQIAAVEERRAELLRRLREEENDFVRIALTDLIGARTDELRTLKRITAQEEARLRVQEQIEESRTRIQPVFDIGQLRSPEAPEESPTGLTKDEIDERIGAVAGLVERYQALRSLVEDPVAAANLLSSMTEEQEDALDALLEAEDQVKRLREALATGQAEPGTARVLAAAEDELARLRTEAEVTFSNLSEVIATFGEDSLEAKRKLEQIREGLQELQDDLAEEYELEITNTGLQPQDLVERLERERARQRDRELFADVPLEARDAVQRFRAELEGIEEAGLRGEDAVVAILDAMGRAGVEADQVRGIIERVADELNLTEEQTRLFVEALEDGGEAGGDLQDTLDQVGDSIDGILRLADAFGELDDDVRRVLEGAQSLVSAVGQIAAGNIVAGAVQGLGGLASIVGGFFGGESPGEREAERIRVENTRAIRRLTQSVDAMRGVFEEVPGELIAEARRVFVGDLEDRPGFSRAEDIFNALVNRSDLTGSDIEELGRALGVPVDLVAAVADGFIVVGDNVQVLEEQLLGLADALAAVEFDRLFDSFTGQLDILQRRLALFDEEDPTAGVVGLLDLLLRFGGLEAEAPQIAAAIAAAIEDEEITAAERRNLESLLQELFEGVVSGRFSPAILGDLRLGEFLDALGDAESGLDDLAQAAEDAERQGPDAQSFQIFRGVTELTGRNILGILTTQDFRLAQIVENTARMVDLAGGEGLRSGFLSPGGVPQPGPSEGPLEPPTTIELDDTLPLEPRPIPVEGGDVILTVESVGPITVEEAVDPQLTAQQVIDAIVDQLMPQVEERFGEFLIRVRRDAGEPPTRLS